MVGDFRCKLNSISRKSSVSQKSTISIKSDSSFRASEYGLPFSSASSKTPVSKQVSRPQISRSTTFSHRSQISKDPSLVSHGSTIKSSVSIPRTRNFHSRQKPVNLSRAASNASLPVSEFQPYFDARNQSFNV